MRITELTNAPTWLKQATVENENVEIVHGIVIWYSGIWYGGIWNGGAWKGGDWKG